MSNLHCLITIAQRALCDDVESFLGQHCIETSYTVFCHGTAQEKTLDILGIEDTNKALSICITSPEMARRVSQGFVEKLGFGLNGRGIALSVPLMSIGGVSCLNELTLGQNLSTSEDGTMNEYDYALILAISKKGSSDLVMEAARSAGATGGTVISGKGTGDEHKFMGVSIASEKDIILIVSRKNTKDTIMKAIMQNAGINSEAKTVTFALPVSDIAGISRLSDIPKL